ncbi:hypothetical protein DSL72_008659 [Monilinia vaccinii-corymbosi]|uniref:Uncharacterized protein n=1 Tax=Monilinia vaccinii-corymbosi TaxID=61207 RepID=A0A8A3PRU8_9HELO|nr:hypothetical protein DSL72_008659 [Monilinia vaccinii-corymbosi]
MAEEQQRLGRVRAEHAEREGAEGEGDEEEGGESAGERLEGGEECGREDSEGDAGAGAGAGAAAGCGGGRSEMRKVVCVEEEERDEREGYADDVCEDEEDAQWEC